MPDIPAKRIVIPSHVLVSEVDGEMVLLNLENESYYGLDDVGTRFWAVLTTSPSIQEACDTLLGEYAVEPDALARDLLQLIEKLRAQGLLEIRDVQS